MLEVGIPVYHSRKTLPKTLDSLVAQTKSMFITCLSIDGDEDKYEDIIKTYEARGLHIRVINSKENGGPGMARQKVFDTTQCDYVSFLDSDDMLMPRAVELLYSEAKSHNYDILASDFIRETKGTDDVLMRADNRSCTWFHGSAYKVSFIREKNIRFDPSLRSEEDAYFNVIAYNSTLNKGKLNEVTYLWRENPESITRKGTRADYYKRSCDGYMYSQIKGMKKIVEINEEISHTLVNQTIINLYRHYMKGKYYKVDLSLMESYLSELKDEVWFQQYLNCGDNWIEIVQNLPGGDFIEDNTIIFYEEPFNKWVERLLKNESYSN